MHETQLQCQSFFIYTSTLDKINVNNLSIFSSIVVTEGFFFDRALSIISIENPMRDETESRNSL